MDKTEVSAAPVKILVATIGNQDPISPKTQQPMAALTLFMEHRPSLVYLIPSAKRDDVKSSTYPQAVATRDEMLRWGAGQGFKPEVRVLSLDVSNATNTGEVFRETERHLKWIEDETRSFPERQFLVTWTSGTYQMSQAMESLIASGRLPGASAYYVANPEYLKEGEPRIRLIEYPPPRRRRPRIAIFVDHENVDPKDLQGLPERLRGRAEKIGDVAVAYVGAAYWKHKADQDEYSKANFTALSFPKGPEAADFSLLSLADLIAKARPDIDTYIIVTDDEHFFHGMVSVLDMGKKVLYWKRRDAIHRSWDTLQQKYGDSIKIESVQEIFRAAQQNKTPTKAGSLIKRKKRSGKKTYFEILTADEDSLRDILLEEIPEMKDGTVEIKSIARAKGKMSKIAVRSSKEGLDPVACCYGNGDVNISKIKGKINNEPIFFIQWYEQPEQLIARAFGEVDIRVGDIDTKTGTACVFVPPAQMGKAIGYGAVNVKTAGRLTGLQIVVKEETA